MPAEALYYPHWGIDNPNFLFESLLYWDGLACIVPYDGFKPQGYAPGELGRGIELMHEDFITGIAPTEEVKQRVHERLEEILDRPPPPWCRPEVLTPAKSSVLAMRKVNPDTFRMLEEHGWTLMLDNETWRVSRAVSGLVLGAIARELASDWMPPVTDERETFRANCNALLLEVQSRQGVGISAEGAFQRLGPDELDEEDELGIVLAKITRIGITDEGIRPGMFERLHRLRLDPGFNEQRQQFREQVDRYVAELRARPVVEHPVIHDHWKRELASDRKDLRRELRAAGIEAITEKEGWIATGTAAAIGAGSFAASAGAGPAVLAIGLGLAGYGITDRLLKRRKEVSDGHWTSWLAAAFRDR